MKIRDKFFQCSLQKQIQTMAGTIAISVMGRSLLLAGFTEGKPQIQIILPYLLVMIFSLMTLTIRARFSIILEKYDWVKIFNIHIIVRNILLLKLLTDLILCGLNLSLFINQQKIIINIIVLIMLAEMFLYLGVFSFISNQKLICLYRFAIKKKTTN